MRFDDSLKTVLSGDIVSGHGAQAAWRQLVDLMSRGRIAADEPVIARLRLLRQAVPATVRAASARALAFAQPPAALVGLFAEDELAIAAPVLRTATLPGDDWIDLLPRLGPTQRSILRHRRDLPGAVTTALAAFGATDFVIAQDPAATSGREAPAPAIPSPANDAAPAPDAPLSETPFVALGDVTRSLPLVAEALRQADAAPPVRSAPGGFVISDLVARIDAFNRAREEPAAVSSAPTEASSFRYETDAQGVIRWVEGVARAALVGVSLAYGAAQGVVRVDGIAAGALRRRSRFGDARLEVGGSSDAAGSWRMSGVPVFDPASGRFTGLRGTARRPRADETAVPRAPVRSTAAADSLRQLVHELRTPTNAIAGFAELIETQLLGDVPDPYREQAGTIRAQASALIAAIDDLDVAARIEGRALELRSGVVPVAAMLERIVADLQPLASLRGATLVVDGASAYPIAGDDRAIERLVGRLLAALTSASSAGERVAVRFADEGGNVAIAIDRPRALGTAAGDTLLSLDTEEDEREGAPLLGTGFALRLAHNLAIELSGALTIGADRLTLRLPAALNAPMEQASNP
ncbi:MULTISPECIES: HAMP domain-containing sensor histidine kinase [unclassified Sphingomonas]|uniref:sensor histidine kinase n=1 Tax=unclassified Sphingomonas TaxID=196159 RepID=UPI00226A38C6|nr:MULTISPECIES: HAMP domain-containing sensor histidine kinase [unclassified Sphingomonas]